MSETESPSFLKENLSSQNNDLEQDDVKDAAQNSNIGDDNDRIFDQDEVDSPPTSSPTKDSELEQTLEEQILQLRKSIKHIERDYQTLKRAQLPRWQLPFQNGAKNLFIGSVSCRSCLYHCEFGGVYLNISFEDVDAFLASEAAEICRKSNNCSRDISITLKKDWLNTIALGDIEVDCRWTGEGRRDLRISNGEKSYHIASLCSEGFILGRSGLSMPSVSDDGKYPWLPSLLEFRPFNRLIFSPWIYEFPEYESMAVCECSSNSTRGFVAAGTHSNILRIFGFGGSLLHTENLPPIICLTATKDILAVLLQTSAASSTSFTDLEPTPMHHVGKQLMMNLAEAPRENQNIYKVVLYRIDTSAKCPVERIDVSPDLHLSHHIQWFGLTNDSTHNPVIVTEDNQVIMMGYGAIQSGYVSRQMTNEDIDSSRDYFATHVEVFRQNEGSDTRISPTRFTDSRRCNSYVAAWYSVAQRLESLKLRDFIVHSCTTKYIDLLPASTSFVCHSLTRVYFQLPLCLPPSLIALRNKYPIDLPNIIAFNTLTKEEKQSRGLNPLTTHFLDEQSVRLRGLALLPLLRNAAWRPAESEYSAALVEEFFEAKSAVEVANTQSAVLALHDGNAAAFAQCIAQVNNPKALALIERQMQSNNNGEFAKAWSNRFSQSASRVDEQEEIVPIQNACTDEGWKQSKKEPVAKPPRSVETNLASLITGSIDLRNNMKKRRID